MPNKEHLGLFRSYLSHPNSEFCTIFFGLLILQGTFYKIVKIFSACPNGWHPVQTIFQVILYEALIFMVLELKSYSVRAHKLQISPRHDLGLVMGHFVGFLQPTLSPFWILGG